MSIFSNLKKRYERATPKQLLLTGVFALAFAAAIGGGLASKQMSSAAGIRDCTVNSIDNKAINGGCGATSANELLLDIWAKQNPDLEEIYAHFGMVSTDYARFKDNARYGMAYTDGRIVVDGETVMTDAWSIGRTKFSYANNYWVNNKLFYWSNHTKVLKQDLPVMVLFDADGTVEFAVLEACGNPVGGAKVVSGAECKSLNMTPAGEKNTYNFTTDATKFGLAKIVKYDYYYNDGNGDKLFATKTNGSDVVTRTFEKSATVSVKVTINLPGGNSKVITSTLCQKQVKVVKEEFMYACDVLLATALDNTNRKFRFTVKTKQSNNVTVDSADFVLDANVKTSGVTAKDQSGNIFKDYTFADNNEHTVQATVFFNTPDGVKSDTGPECKKTVKPKPNVCKITCDKLISTQDKKNPNKYTFTTKATLTPGATVTRVVYTITEEGQPVQTITKTSLNDGVTITFSHNADVSVTVFGKLGGGDEVQSAEVIQCKKHIKYIAPMFACTLLSATMPDPKKDHSFRFTVHTTSDIYTTVKDVSFTLDNTSTTTGVTSPKDLAGHIYKDYTFTDEDEHTVQATVYFNTLEGVKSADGIKCQAKVKAKEQPKCTVPGHENLPPNDPKCKPPVECLPGIPQGDSRCYCKPGVPVGDYRCNPPEECKPGVSKGSADCNPLVNTGPGSVAGLFTGVTAAGALGHRLFMNRRNRG